MKGDTPLDYCVFQLNESRCELWICAGDKNEKLASGSIKPFVAHLRAAKEQISKGGNFIILQAPPFVGDGSPWFTKRTVERFVRFVSTPDVLESVSLLESELAKLDDAASILVSDSSWSAPVTPRSGNLSLYKTETDQQGDQAKGYARRPSFDYAGVAVLDGSKKDLLKAMEMRRMMLLHEQKKAFSHATAAGFNVSCISDLMVFANCFGAPRLWEACLKFMTLCKKRQETGMNPEESLFDSLSADSSNGSIQLVSNSSSSEESSTGSVKAKSRKTWDPQVLSTLQQLHARKVENGSWMSPDGKQVIRRHKTEDPGDEDLVVGARESVNNPFAFLRGSFRSKVEQKTLSVQDAISLFESKQQKTEDVIKKKITKDGTETGKLAEATAVPASDEQHAAESEAVKSAIALEVAEPDEAEDAPAEASAAVAPQQTVSSGCEDSQQVIRKPSALAVVAEATELEELDNIEWKPLCKSSGFVFDDMFLDQRTSAAQNSRRQSLCVWKTSDLDSYEHGRGDKREQKGRFYDQYQEKREAKLKHEPVLKKAEKEAKLKAMHDVLETRRAELSTRSMRLTSSSTKNSGIKKGAESKSCELKIPSRRTSPSSSVHSAPVVKADANQLKTVSVRKSSPSSQKSSTAAARAPSSSVIKTQRKSAESFQPDQHGKENADPLYASDVEGPQKFKFLERKSKGGPLLTRKVVEVNQVKAEASKSSKSDTAVHQKKVLQNRQPSPANSAVKGSGLVEVSKSGESCSASSEILEIKLEGDDTESSCSCSIAENAISLQNENLGEEIEPDATSVPKEVEAVAEVKIVEAIADVEAVEAAIAIEVVEEVPDVEPAEVKDEDEDEACIDPVAIDDTKIDPDEKPEALPGAHAQECDAESVPAAAEDPAAIDISVLIEELEREVELSDVKPMDSAPAASLRKPTPLFELAELDQKQFPAAYKVHPPLEEFSSTTGTQSEASAASSALCSSSDPKAESFGSSKDEGEESTIFNTDHNVGSFLPRRIAAAAGQQQKCAIFPPVATRKSSSDAATRSSSEPGSPTRQPLFDLLANEHNAKSSTVTTTAATAAATATGTKALKSSSHKLPHMCRLPSPDGRGHAAVLEKKNSAPSCTKPLTDAKPLKGFRKFLRFGRRSSSSSSSAAAAAASASETGSSERIMWQNGWFKGEH